MLLVSVLCPVSLVRAQTPTPENPVVIFFFWGDGCPHCAKAKPYFEELPSRFPGVDVKFYEVYNDQANQVIFNMMAQKYGLEQMAVPAFFIGPYFMVGYSEEINPGIEEAIQGCLETGCINPGDGVVTPPVEVLQPTPTNEAISVTQTRFITSTPTSKPINSKLDEQEPPQTLNQTHELVVPILGSVNLEMQSTAFSTVLIAFVDGFNPCSLWVLSMLLALTLHTGSRKKVLLIGLVFLSVTAAIYALFIAGLFSVLKAASFLGWIQVVVALVALFFAMVNIKDYFWYKEGVSFTITDDKKTGIFKRIRAVMDASQSFWGLMSATVVLALGVSLVEFSCTAGFPVLWVNLLTSQNVNGAAFVMLLLLYMAIYQLDEMVLFFSAVVTLKSTRLEEKHGRLLKLVGGMLMLTLSVIMLINPALLNSLSSSLIVFGCAFIATIFVVIVHRKILPRFGIWIGSEFNKSPNEPIVSTEVT